MLQEVKNPFETVLQEIEKMTEVLKQEGDADKAKFDWCDTERTNTQAIIDQKTQLIAQLTTTIGELESQITQLESDIASNEQLLTENRKNQAESTATRKEENVAYQTDISHLVEAQSLLNKATAVLKRYSESLAPEAAVAYITTLRAANAPPAAYQAVLAFLKTLPVDDVAGSRADPRPSAASTRRFTRPSAKSGFSRE